VGEPEPQRKHGERELGDENQQCGGGPENATWGMITR